MRYRWYYRDLRTPQDDVQVSKDWGEKNTDLIYQGPQLAVDSLTKLKERERLFAKVG